LKILNFPRVATLFAMLVCLVFYLVLNENKSVFSLIFTEALLWQTLYSAILFFRTHL
jgi:hypothetical protein